MKRVVPIALLCAATLMLPSAPARSQSTEGLDMQAARAKTMTKKGHTRFYTRTFDLSGLPLYAPKQQVTGTIHVWGSNYITDSPLGEYWAAAFEKFQPGAKLDWHMESALAAVPSLVFKVGDLGMGRKITFAELLLFQRYENRDPVEVTIATGSYDVTGWQPAYGIVVNKANPLARVTMRQLDGIFGAERLGGWEGTSWRPNWGRGPEGNIRTWGQLGLKGEWANKPIHVYGLNMRYHQATEFSDDVLRGSDKWNEHLRIYANYVSQGGKLERGLAEDLVKDPYGISYINGPTASLGGGKAPDFKILPVAAHDAGPYIPYTMDTIQDRTYPLISQIYAYADRPDGTHLDPKVVEFLRFIVSRDGQAEVMRDGKYLPLTAGVANAQLTKLDALEK